MIKLNQREKRIIDIFPQEIIQLSEKQNLILEI